MRTIVYWVSILGSPYLGKLPYSTIGFRVLGFEYYLLEEIVILRAGGIY